MIRRSKKKSEKGRLPTHSSEKVYTNRRVPIRLKPRRIPKWLPGKSPAHHPQSWRKRDHRGGREKIRCREGSTININ